MRLLILRPEPGASATAARARALGLEPVVAPLFTVRRLAWSPPVPEAFDAVMLTSAGAAREAGEGLGAFLHLPCYAIGEATAAAAEAAGFAQVHVGPDAAASLLAIMAEDGVRGAFHPCGADHLALDHPGVSVTRVPVYAAEPVAALPVDPAGMLALLHSPRAARLFAGLVRDRSEVAVAAISAPAAAAAGEGWRLTAIAERPRDEALLELAARLCQKDQR